MLTILLAWPLQAQEKPVDTGKTRKPVLVCSTTQIADFARQVVGDSCEVHCILAPGADPHTYMPTPGDAKLVLKADLCLQNGMHLEGKNWMQTLAQDAGKPLLTCTEGVQPIELEAEGQKVNDPHTWFTPRNAAIYVNNIVRGVSRLDPAHKADYEARARAVPSATQSVGFVDSRNSSTPSRLTAGYLSPATTLSTISQKSTGSRIRRLSAGPPERKWAPV